MRIKWLLVVASVTLLAIIGYVSIRTTGASREEPRETSLQDGTEQPTTAAIIQAHGHVVPIHWADVSFATAGTVAEWYVEEGAVVEAGTVLGRLDSTLLELQLRQAEVTLERARARLEQAQAEHEYQLTLAGLTLEAAQSRLEQAWARFPDLVAPQVRLEQAARAEAAAAYEYQKAQDRSWEPQEVRDAYLRAWENAQDSWAIAQAEYDAVRREQYASGQEIQILEGEVRKAQAEIDYLRAGIDPTLEVEVTSARLAVEEAQAALNAATLVAPFAGTVVTIRGSCGDSAPPGVTLADLSMLRVEVVDLDEWGAAQIHIGSEATLVFPALNGYQVAGRVAAIALRGEEQAAGDVTYRALVTLDEQNPDLRWGMTANVTFPIRR